MPTAAESKAALTLVTGAAESAAVRLLQGISGSPEAIRADLLDGVPALVGYYADGSAALAADFYDDERLRAGARGRFTAEPVVLDRTEKLRRAVVWAMKPLLDGDGDAPGRLAEVVNLEVARPYRDTITTARRRDPAAVGWRRVASSASCKFCRMLADRGAVYRESTARFASHAHCHCTAAPVFEGQDGPEAGVVQYVASKRRPTERDRQRVRDYLAEHYGN